VILGQNGNNYSVAAFVLPNKLISGIDLKEFIVPIDAVEHATGLEFFPQLETKKWRPLCGQIECSLPSFHKHIKAIASYFLMSFFFGGGESVSAKLAPEIVSSYCKSAQSSVHLEDRRAAVRSMRSVARDHQLVSSSDAGNRHRGHGSAD
jgi:hypothetical protein